MKKVFILALALVLLLASCSKKNDDVEFDLITIPEGATLALMNPHTLDVERYNRDNSDIESLISAVNELSLFDLENIYDPDLESGIPFVRIFVEKDETHIYNIWSLGEGRCVINHTRTGSADDIYTFAFDSESIAALVGAVHAGFEG